jgi:exopolysaccharide biosynthesis polyprenyl glycosylphosphotransferase
MLNIQGRESHISAKHHDNRPMKKPLLDRLKVLSRRQQVVILALMLIPDAIAIALSAFTAYNFRFSDAATFIDGKPAIAQFEYKKILFVLVCAWIFTLVATGSYRFNHATLVVFNLRLVIKRSLTYFFILGFVSFILKASFSRSLFLVMLGSGITYLFLARLSVYALILRPLILRKKVSSNMLIVGRQKTDLDEHSDWLIEHRTLGFMISARLICTEINSIWIEEFDNLVSRKKISEVLLLPGMESDLNFSKFIHYCEDLNIHVNWIPLDSGNLGYWLIPSPQEGIPFLTFERSEITLPWRIVKRSFDLLFSLTLMLFLSPLFVVIAVSVLLSSGWPVFYSQKRVGLNGKTFKFYKFRSMVKNADQIVHEVENIHRSDHVLFKNRTDPRVTPIGRILRKYSLDELPQFLNVINNSMSVVGPRPALPKEVNVYNSIYERRLIAKPGITGPWQISGRSDLDLRTSVALDLNYLINWSFTRDLWIIVSTVGAVFKGKGAY